MSSRRKLPTGVPASLKFGSVSFRVFTTKEGRFGFRYKSGSSWKQAIRSDLRHLRADAERIALSITNAETEALDVDASDRRIYVAAREVLAPMGVDVDRAARILRDAADAAGGVDRIVEACKWFGRVQPTAAAVQVAVVIEEYIRKLRSDGQSAIYIEKMEADLEAFSAAFPREIASCRTKEIDDWLLSREVGPRRRRNLLGKIVSLFNFARRRNYLPETLKTEAEKTTRPKVPREAPKIYSPDELNLLIVQCYQEPDARYGRKGYEDFVAPLVIGAFAGLRWAEIQSLDWQRDILWDEGYISVGDENKTGHRQPPIHPNLAKWLAPYRGRMGAVCPFARPDNIIRRLGMRAGLPVGGRRYANALRHSYVSYRMAITKNAPLVAEECGHSISELKRSYLRRQLEAAARKWFAIEPGEAANVIPLPFSIATTR
jgi:integrase